MNTPEWEEVRVKFKSLLEAEIPEVEFETLHGPEFYVSINGQRLVYAKPSLLYAGVQLSPVGDAETQVILMDLVTGGIALESHEHWHRFILRLANAL